MSGWKHLLQGFKPKPVLQHRWAVAGHTFIFSFPFLFLSFCCCCFCLFLFFICLFILFLFFGCLFVVLYVCVCVFCCCGWWFVCFAGWFLDQHWFRSPDYDEFIESTDHTP